MLSYSPVHAAYPCPCRARHRQLNALRVRHGEVVADNLRVLAHGGVELREGFEVVLVERVLDRDQAVVVDPLLVVPPSAAVRVSSRSTWQRRPFPRCMA